MSDSLRETVTYLAGLPSGPTGRAPLVRPAYRILSRSHASVSGLFQAVDILDATRRDANEATNGRTSKVELDVLRSAIVFTSAGLDATMKRLVNDVGRRLVTVPGTGARRVYEEYVKRELLKPKVSDSFKDSILDPDPGARLVAHYLADRTKASFQGSGDLEKRVRRALGIAGSQVREDELKRLDDFFLARNKISHDMDLKNPNTESVAREHRTPGQVADQCNEVFDVAVKLIHGAALACKSAGV